MRTSAILLRLAALIAAALAIASCTSILGLDDYSRAGEDLCALLARCYSKKIKACEEHVEARLTEGHDYVEKWLQEFSDKDCLASCANARRCLDLRPVCDELDEPGCDRKEDCCDFTQGHADCDNNACCLSLGVKCETGAKDRCCPGAGQCSTLTRTCGGVVCLDNGQTCIADKQCCTGLCKGGVCIEGGCSDDGFDCKDDVDCCSKHCNAEKKCDTPMTCSVLGGKCMNDGECCAATPALKCFIPPNEATGSCSSGACIPLNGDCSDASQCCTGNCDRDFFVCASSCHLNGDSCSASVPCCNGKCDNNVCVGACSNGYCTADDQCCPSGDSQVQKCNLTLKVCEICSPAPCMSQHSPCDIGTAMNTMCGDACTTAVCALDSFCCCTAWDQVCVDEALMMNGTCICM